MKQKAYSIAIVTKDDKIFEETGKIVSSNTYYFVQKHVPSRTRLKWIIKLWDENDLTDSVSVAYFETGLDKHDWSAKWINPELSSDKRKRNPASYLRKKFSVLSLGEARLYITSYGIFNVLVNGREVTDKVLLPGTSQVNKRLMVETIDVSDYILLGANALDITLGDGWYRGSNGFFMKTNTFGTDLALLCQLEISHQVVCVSDETWLASQNGPLGLNDMMMGEYFDATKEVISDWHQVKIVKNGYNNLIGVHTVAIKEHEKFKASVIRTENGETILDFGQNLAGYVYMELTAEKGQKITLTHGETLDKNGNFTTHNFQNPMCPKCYQKVEYICKAGLNKYKPTKCYFGYRYVKVESDIEITGDEFISIAVYSEMKQTGFFECGNEAVNQLFKNAIWSMKSNFVDIPTDCPTREKSGFSADCYVFIHTAMYLFDCYSIYKKWHAEQCATQFDDGCVRQIAPDYGKRTQMDGGLGWCNSMEIIPYKLAERYGDETALEKNYESIKRWIQFCLKRAEKTKFENSKLLPKNLRKYFADKGFLWGEWMEPGIEPVQYIKDITSNGDPEVGTAYLFYSCKIMSEIAKLLNKKEDETFFADVAEMVKSAYRYVYVKEGIIKSSRQCRFVRPIMLGILNDEEKLINAKILTKIIEENANKVNTGFLTSHELCRVLTDNNQSKKAYDVLLQEGYPSWLYSVKKGATTIWERWEGINDCGDVKGSLNHFAYGAIVGWLFDRTCGINVANGKLKLTPFPDRRLLYAKAIYFSPYGEIKAGWCYNESKIVYQFEVPCNTKAELILPNEEQITIETGYHSFERILETDDYNDMLSRAVFDLFDDNNSE